MLRDMDEAILDALEIYASAGDVAAVTGAPFRRIIYLQRLYGPARVQQQRAEEDRLHRQEARAERPHPLSDAEAARRRAESPQGEYWREFERLGSPTQRPPEAVEAMLEGLRTRRRGGRGVA